MKVLVLSHNCFSTSQNMGKSLMGLFQSFSKEEVCQLYLYPSYPNVDYCHSSYKITDIDMLKKVVKNQEPGERVGKDCIHVENGLLSQSGKSEQQIYHKGTQRKPYMILARNLLWRLGHWNTTDLKQWLSEESPDVIFYASGDGAFSFRIARTISKQLNIPLISYICDDYYFLCKKTYNPLYHFNRFVLHREMKKTYGSSEFLITICNSMSQAYEQIFRRKTITLMTSSTQPADKSINPSTKYGICYTGNVSINRWKSLLEIGRSLQSINAEIGSHYILNVYSGEIDPDILAQFTEQNGIRFCGCVSSERVIEIVRKSLLIVHVESMEVYDRARVRFSVSTKIADALALAKCIFAYGPEEVASIQHLIKHKAACVVTDPIKLKETLSKLLSSEEQRNSYIESARDLAFQRHNGARDSTMLKTMLEKVVMEGKKI